MYRYLKCIYIVVVVDGSSSERLVLYLERDRSFFVRGR